MIPDDPARTKHCCVAGVLVGGRSRRMGRPKASLLLPNGKRLVEQVAGAALEAVKDVVLLGEPAGPLADQMKLPVLADAKAGGGPVAGLCSLLEYARPRWVLLLACDMPCLGAGALRRLLAEMGAGVDAVAFLQDPERNVFHACCALYHPRVLPIALEELLEGGGKLQRVLSRVRVAALVPNADEMRQLTNVNTPEDLRRLAADAWPA